MVASKRLARRAKARPATAKEKERAKQLIESLQNLMHVALNSIKMGEAQGLAVARALSELSNASLEDV